MAGEVELKMLLVSLFMKTACYRKSGKDQEFKFDALAIGSAGSYQTKLGQFRNQLQTQEYPKT